MPKKKLIIIVVALLVVVGGVYKFVLSGGSADASKPKIDGVVYVLGKEFLVNLSDDRYAKFSVAIVLPEAPAAEGETTPPEGYGALPEEAAVRDVVTDVVGASTGEALSSAAGRERIKKAIRRRIKQTTDVEVGDVLFPDITVQ